MSGDSRDGPRVREPNAPATEPQRRLLERLGIDRAGDPNLTRGAASELIDSARRSAEQEEPKSKPSQGKLPDGEQPDQVSRPPTEIVSAGGRTAAEVSRALAPEAGETPELIPSSDMTALLVRPEVNIEAAKKLWEAYKKFRDFLLADEACFDVIEGSKEMNRTGATRLAVPFGLSIEERSVDEKEFAAEGGKKDVRFIVRIRVSKGGRFVDGVGTSRLSEIAEETRGWGKTGDKDYRPPKKVPIGQREHFAYTRAWTRGAKRAIADMLGGTEAE